MDIFADTLGQNEEGNGLLLTLLPIFAEVSEGSLNNAVNGTKRYRSHNLGRSRGDGLSPF